MNEPGLEAPSVAWPPRDQASVLGCTLSMRECGGMMTCILPCCIPSSFGRKRERYRKGEEIKIYGKGKGERANKSRGKGRELIRREERGESR